MLKTLSHSRLLALTTLSAVLLMSACQADTILGVDIGAPAAPVAVDELTVATAESEPSVIAEPTPAAEPTVETEPTVEAKPTPLPRAAILATLGNLSYEGLLPDQAIALTDGLARYEDGSSGTPFVRLLDRLLLRGDLDGDGREDAVALLEDESSGSGRFVYVAAVLDVLGTPRPLQPFMIGDRVQVKDLVLDGSEVIVDFIGPGDSDPACCPGSNLRQVLALSDGALVDTGTEELGRVTLGDLDGTSWRLVELDSGDEPLPSDSKVTLTFDGETIRGTAGCNSYEAVIRTADPALVVSLAVDSITVGDALCSEADMALEAAYLGRLQQAMSWGYDSGALLLSYLTDDLVRDRMLLEPLNAPSP